MFRFDDLRIIVISVLMFTLMLHCAEAKAQSSCDKGSVYCALTKNRPDMDRLTLRRIADLFIKYSRKYDQDPITSVAIGMQETGLRQRNRHHNIIVFNPDGITWRVERGVTDVCMFQFHVDTIVDMNIDPIKLKDNIDYCIEQHFKLMSVKRKICSDIGEDSWTCYHSKNPRLRETYKKLVARYF
jgi:hypothetical protein